MATDDDETAYLLRSPANRDRLEAALAASRARRRTLADVYGPEVMAGHRKVDGRPRARQPFGHADLLALCPSLPSDYTDYGGTVERWERDGEDYPDCSCGCVWAAWLDGEFRADWLVCANPRGARAGLLTFEHQHGREPDGAVCFEAERDYKARRKAERAAGGPPDGA